MLNIGGNVLIRSQTAARRIAAPDSDAAQRLGSRAGLSLVEALISMGLVGLAVATLVATVTFANRSIEANRARNLATVLAQQGLEDVTAYGFNGILSRYPYTPVQVALSPVQTATRRVTVIGHRGDGSPETNSIVWSEYLEVHVDIVYYTVRHSQPITNRVSMIVQRD